MSSEERTTVLVAIIGIVLCVIAFIFVFLWDSERSKRTELEAENVRIVSIMDRVVNASMTTRYTMGACYLYQGEISLLIAEYFGHQRLDFDSLLAVPPKSRAEQIIFNDTVTINDTILVDSSEVTDE